MTARRSPTATENDTSSIARRAPNSRVTPSNTRASPDTSVEATSNSSSHDRRCPHTRGVPRLGRGAQRGGCGGPYRGPGKCPHTRGAPRRGRGAQRGGGGGPYRGPPPHGQLGSSREPILNSAGGMPSVWFTLSIFRSTLL